MSSGFDWDKILKLIHQATLEGGSMTIEFQPDIFLISDRLDLLCDCLGIAYMTSPDNDKNHYSIAGLKRTWSGNKVKIVLPESTNFPGFIGIRAYHVNEHTLSRRLFLGKDLIRKFPN